MHISPLVDIRRTVLLHPCVAVSLVVAVLLVVTDMLVLTVMFRFWLPLIGECLRDTVNGAGLDDVIFYDGDGLHAVLHNLLRRNLHRK